MRYGLMIVTLAVATWPAVAQDNAEKLYRDLEQKLHAAKTLSLTFELSATNGDGDKEAVKGTLTLGEDDKFLMEGEGKADGKTTKFVVVSDGANIKTSEKSNNQVKVQKCPKGVGAFLRGGLARDGFFVSSTTLYQFGGMPPDALKMADFKLLGKEKVGGREAQVIQWAFKEDGKTTASVKLWLDGQTQLPLKRVVTGIQTAYTEITEIYSAFTLNPKVDAKTFQVAK